MDQKALDKELFNALNSNDVDGIKKALKNGANGNAVTKKGTTPLMIVAKMNHNMMPQRELADLLIKNGADVNFVNKRGFTVVSNMMKSAYFDTKLLEHLIKNHGVDMNQRVAIKQDGELKEFSLLDYAYLNSINEDLVKLLKDNGAKGLEDSERLKDGFDRRSEILDKVFSGKEIYDIIDDFKNSPVKSSSKIPGVLETLKGYIFDESYVEGHGYLKDVEDIVSDFGDDGDMLFFLYLKASIYICLNTGYESLEMEIERLRKKGSEKKWDAVEFRENIEKSGLRDSIKSELNSLSHRIESL